MINVALYQPSIPPNTGNIARQCVGMNARLHLVGPLAFDMSEKALHRAGLDYWDHLDLTLHETPEQFLEFATGRRCWLITKTGPQRYDEPDYRDEDILVFGNEISGVPEAWHARWAESRCHIPILGQVRSYNLSNAVALVLAQAMARANLYRA